MRASDESRTEAEEAVGIPKNPQRESDPRATEDAFPDRVEGGPGDRAGQVTRPSAERRNARLLLACNIYRARLDRALFFQGMTFTDIAWDTLLAIYVFAAAGRTLSAGELAGAVVESSMTSALRMQRRLVDLGLIRRIFDTADKRRMLVELTPEGEAVLEDYLDHTLERRIVPANDEPLGQPNLGDWLGGKVARKP